MSLLINRSQKNICNSLPYCEGTRPASLDERSRRHGGHGYSGLDDELNVWNLIRKSGRRGAGSGPIERISKGAICPRKQNARFSRFARETKPIGRVGIIVEAEIDHHIVGAIKSKRRIQVERDPTRCVDVLMAPVNRGPPTVLPRKRRIEECPCSMLHADCPIGQCLAWWARNLQGESGNISGVRQLIRGVNGL